MPNLASKYAKFANFAILPAALRDHTVFCGGFQKRKNVEIPRSSGRRSAGSDAEEDVNNQSRNRGRFLGSEAGWQPGGGLRSKLTNVTLHEN